ncbi:MAG: hypothetical protein V3U11_11110, partial [Planctomycetota bacterium]
MAEPSQVETMLQDVHVGLRHDLLFNRQDLGGQPRYVVHDPLSFKNHVFSALEYRIMTAIIPDMSLERNFRRLIEAEVLTEADHERFFNFVVQLH